jgi:hypothetical protein
VGIAVGQAAPTIEVAAGHRGQEQARSGLRYLGRNRQLVLGLPPGLLALFVILGTSSTTSASTSCCPVPLAGRRRPRFRSGPTARAAI